MAVTSVKETWHARSSDWDDRQKRTYRRSWRVITDNVHTEQYEVLSAVGVSLFASYSADAYALVRLLRCEQKDDEPRLWMVEAEYATGQGQVTQRDPASEQQPNPTLRPSVVSWTNTLFQRPAVRDRNGNAIIMSTKEYPNPPVDVDDILTKLSIQRYEASFNESVAMAFMNSVNSDWFFGAPPGTWKCLKFDARSHYENGFTSWDVTYEFEFRWQTWRLKVLDQSYHERIRVGEDTPEVYRLSRIYTKEGEPVSSPALLNGDGRNLELAVTTLYESLSADATDDVLQLDPDVAGSAFFPGNVGPGNVNEAAVMIDSEIMELTEYLGSDQYRVTRGARGTDVASHNQDVKVVLEPVYRCFDVYREAAYADLTLP